MNIDVNMDWNGLSVTGTVVYGDWEGDGSIPRGKKYLPPYVSDMMVDSPEEEPFDKYLNEMAHQEIVDAMIEWANERVA